MATSNRDGFYALRSSDGVLSNTLDFFDLAIGIELRDDSPIYFATVVRVPHGSVVRFMPPYFLHNSLARNRQPRVEPQIDSFAL